MLSQWREVARSFSGREAKFGTVAVVSAIVVLGILVALNYLGVRHNKRWDMTAAKQFTLSEARRRGGEMTEEARQDARVLRFETIKFYTGLTLLIAGYLAPIVWSPTALRKWVMTVLVGTMVTLVFMYKVFFQKGWHHAMLVAGLLSATLGAMILAIG